MLNMPKYDEVWHQADLADELAEYEKATGLIARWSELSDIVYTCTQGRWSGHTK
jgi:spore germination protein GerM